MLSSGAKPEDSNGQGWRSSTKAVGKATKAKAAQCKRDSKLAAKAKAKAKEPAVVEMDADETIRFLLDPQPAGQMPPAPAEQMPPAMQMPPALKAKAKAKGKQGRKSKAALQTLAEQHGWEDFFSQRCLNLIVLHNFVETLFYRQTSVCRIYEYDLCNTIKAEHIYV